jgi:hypothetical protein
LAALIAWFNYSSGQYWSAAVSAASGVLALGLQHVARRQALGWITDEHGERQKVGLYSRGQSVFTPTTRDRRLVEEAFAKKERRQVLVRMGAVAWPLSFLAWRGFALYPDDVWTVVGIFSALFAIVPMAAWLKALALEIAYQAGYQDMKGAKVLDPIVARSGLQEVQQQKAHGAGRIATQDEAIASLNPEP